MQLITSQTMKRLIFSLLIIQVFSHPVEVNDCQEKGAKELKEMLCNTVKEELLEEPCENALWLNFCKIANPCKNMKIFQNIESPFGLDTKTKHIDLLGFLKNDRQIKRQNTFNGVLSWGGNAATMGLHTFKTIFYTIMQYFGNLITQSFRIQ